jgi:O-antigen/teichoic acid export membrane protein
MKGKRYLAKNMFFLTIGQFGTKLLSFFLVPLYTSVLTSAEYGTYDLYSATVGLFVPILTVNIADATSIFLLDKKNSKEGIVSISLKYYFYSLLIFTAFICINFAFNFVPLFNEYPLFLFLMFATNGINQLLLNYARGFDRIKDVSISGVLCSAVMIALNVTFLLPMHMGLKGYYLATIGGTFCQILYLCISLKIFKFIKVRRQDKKLKKEMLSYSCPMILNTVSWWINNVSDRYIVTAMCGIVENGIYSVAYKIPSVLTMFQSIFSQAWTLSAVQDFDSKDKNGFFSKMYAFYNVSMVLLCSLLIIFTRPIAQVLFANDFYNAWRYVPFLLVSVVFGSLSGYLGGIFAAVKDSSSFAVSTVVGAISNIILNIVLIHFIGTIGAAVSTAVSYAVVWVMRMYKVKRIIKLDILVIKDCFVYAILVLQTVVVLISERLGAWNYVINIVFLLAICIFYRRNFVQIVEFAKRKIGVK